MPASHSSILKNYERIEALPDTAEARKLKRLARSTQEKFGDRDLSAGWTDFLSKAEARDLLVVMPGTIGRTARLTGTKRRARTPKVFIVLSPAQRTVFGALGDALSKETLTGPPPFVLTGETLRVFALGGTRNYLSRVLKGLDDAIEAKSLTKYDANKIRLSITAVLRKLPELPPTPRATNGSSNGSLSHDARGELVGV